MQGDEVMLKVSFENGKKYEKEYGKDPYMQMFLGNYILRDSCYNCRFKGDYYQSDFTIGDFWEYEEFYPRIDDYGVSALAINSFRGEKLLDKINDKAVIKDASQEALVYGNYSYQYSVKRAGLAGFYFLFCRHIRSWRKFTEVFYRFAPICWRIVQKLKLDSTMGK